MAVSINDLVQRVRDLLGEQPTVLTSTTTGTGTSITVSDPADLSEGDVLEWQTGTVGFEQMLIVGDPAGANPVTVSRGFMGTTAETHTSGDTLFVTPVTTGRQIQQALSTAMRSLFPAVYTVESKLQTPSSTWAAEAAWRAVTNHTTTPLGFVRIEQKWGAAPYEYLGQYGMGHDLRGDMRVNVRYDLPTSMSSSGVGLMFPDGFFHQTNDIITIAQLPLTGTADIEDSAFLPVADCLVYLAVGALTQAGEVPRVAQGGDLEASSTVGTGARLQTGSFYANLGRQMRDFLKVQYELKYRPAFPATENRA